ncbi:hypothetical protein BVI2075_70085 [Burkholderia vietnamiensis]|nr:hypothetical protein BVI2075_70085 [Burkholderia vietnamiensis]
MPAASRPHGHAPGRWMPRGAGAVATLDVRRCTPRNSTFAPRRRCVRVRVHATRAAALRRVQRALAQGTKHASFLPRRSVPMQTH